MESRLRLLNLKTMNILLIGNGAREHIMGQKLFESPHCDQLLVYGKTLNPGLKSIAHEYHVGDLMDNAAIVEFAKKFNVDLAVVGPEAPLVNGVVDALEAADVSCASPTKACAQLEGSKSFTRELIAKYNLDGNPGFRTFTTPDGMMEFAQELGQIVVKADGLHGGKGVWVQGDHFENLEEGVAQAKKFLASDGSVVIEEKLVGQEFSLMSFVDGETVVDMPPIQDHKRAHDGDTGPNTGGMGTYSTGKNLPFLNDADLKIAHAITVQVANALKEELGQPFKGVMYGGFMAVKNGVRLIEYNARLGDPEAMNALSLLETDFVEVCQAIANGTLSELEVKFSDQATVCKYVVPKGYPTDPVRGEELIVGELPDGANVYFASVDQGSDKRLIMTGSRAAAFIGVGEALQEAEQLAQKGVEQAEGPIFYRTDIGTKAVVEKKVEMMREVRG